MSKWVVVKSVQEMQDFYLSILPNIREVAKSHGYALGLHGSTTRDFDLIAVPWIDTFSDKDTLAREIQKAACGFTMKYDWENKPNNRFAVSFPICFIDYTVFKDERLSLGHIDLSVIGGL